MRRECGPQLLAEAVENFALAYLACARRRHADAVVERVFNQVQLKPDPTNLTEPIEDHIRGYGDHVVNANFLAAARQTFENRGGDDLSGHQAFSARP